MTKHLQTTNYSPNAPGMTHVANRAILAQLFRQNPLAMPRRLSVGAGGSRRPPRALIDPESCFSSLGGEQQSGISLSRSLAAVESIGRVLKNTNLWTKKMLSYRD